MLPRMFAVLENHIPVGNIQPVNIQPAPPAFADSVLMVSLRRGTAV